MTGMSATDRIPLLERELLRIQNELVQARRQAYSLLRQPGVQEGILLACVWLEQELGEFAATIVRARLTKELGEDARI